MIRWNKSKWFKVYICLFLGVVKLLNFEKLFSKLITTRNGYELILDFRLKKKTESCWFCLQFQVFKS